MCSSVASRASILLTPPDQGPLHQFAVLALCKMTATVYVVVRACAGLHPTHTPHTLMHIDSLRSPDRGSGCQKHLPRQDTVARCKT